MSLLVSALQPHIVRGLYDVRGVADRTLDDLIGSRGAFYPAYDSSTTTWKFNFISTEIVSAFLAHECARFACAAFQSYSEISTDIRVADRVPWAIVRAYYAAFYAGHSLLRALGSTCTWFDGNRVATLRKLLALYGISQPFDSGLYETEVDPMGASILVRKIGSSVGGSHEQFWLLFKSRLIRLEAEILAGTLPQRDAQQVWALLGQLRDVITRGASNDSWLSLIRNNVQYKQDLKIWFPNQAPSRDRQTLSNIASGWSGDPLAIHLSSSICGDLGSFLAATTFLVASCRVVLTRIAELGKRGRSLSFAYHGPLRYVAMQQRT